MPRIAKTKIIQIAEENVSRGSELNTIADDRLNLIIDQLYHNFSWPTHQAIANITFNSGVTSVTLPSDYLRSGVVKLIIPNSNPPAEIEIPVINFYDYALQNTPESEARPKRIMTRRFVDKDGEIQVEAIVWPKPDQGYSGKIYYERIQDYDVADAKAPAFLDLQSLVDLLTNALKGLGYGHELPPPYDPFLLEKLLGRMRRNLADEGIYPTRARLDGRMFVRRRRQLWPADIGNP